MSVSVINERRLAELMGYTRIGDVERKLIEQGIRPIYGKPGHFFVTKEMLNKSIEGSRNKKTVYDELI